MSASLSASASLTPSPVIATTWPATCSAPTIARFWCGVTRPNTECVSSTSASASRSSGSSRASTASLGAGQPDATRRPPPTVAGCRPRSPSASTPWSRKYAQRVGRVGPDLLLEHHERDRRQARRQRFAVERRVGAREQQARAGRRPRARRPVGARGRRRACRPSTISGAPITHVPCPSNAAALHLRADENGTAPVRAQPVGRGERRARARRRSRCGSRRRRARRGASSTGAPSSSASTSSKAIVALGERAGLVEADDVDAGEPLDRGQLLHEHVAAGQA